MLGVPCLLFASLISTNFCTKEEKHAVVRVFDDADFRSIYGLELAKIFHHGVGIHHAGLLPKYRLLVKKLTRGQIQHGWESENDDLIHATQKKSLQGV